MLTERQQKAYKQFYDATHDNEFLDAKTELLVGLAAAMAVSAGQKRLQFKDVTEQFDIDLGEFE